MKINLIFKLKNSVFYIIIFCFLFVIPLSAQASYNAVPTFNCIGLYWNPANGSSSNECTVSYRLSGSATWKKALSLWYDNGEYRGSIVNLDQGREYEIKLNLLSTKDSITFKSKTWSEDFPVSSIVYLPETSNSTLTISNSGSNSGYILYTHNPNKSATIDVKNDSDFCINIAKNVHHVIIRGLTLINAKNSGINLAGSNKDIVIDHNDISNWGNGSNGQAAIYTNNYNDSEAPERIIIQNNEMHDPRFGSNSWASGHPKGPQGIFFAKSGGNLVIRHNKIHSKSGRYFNDGMGAFQNFSNTGFPNKDSDIYGNYISDCWDDGIESEGGNTNVRIWGNYIDNTFVKIAIGAVNVGPVYIWRNIGARSRKYENIANSDSYGRGPFIKAGAGKGRAYIFHNTILQPSAPSGQKYTLGCDGGIINSAGSVYEHKSRNNIFTNYNTSHTTFKDGTSSPTNSFDYDLYTGKIDISRAHQLNGISAQPVFSSSNKEGEFALDINSKGIDAGEIIPNFNDDYKGNGPDVGAFESGSIFMSFGPISIDDTDTTDLVTTIFSPKGLRVVGD